MDFHHADLQITEDFIIKWRNNIFIFEVLLKWTLFYDGVLEPYAKVNF